jgi:hypothetical protein
MNRFDIALGKIPELIKTHWEDTGTNATGKVPKTLDDAVDALRNVLMTSMSDKVSHITLWTEIRAKTISWSALPAMVAAIGETQALLCGGHMTEDEFLGRFHHSIGQGIRNDWGLWSDSDLAKYFNSIGINHADDMSGIIFKSLYREMTGKERDLEGQIKHYQDYWKQAENMTEGKIFTVDQNGKLLDSHKSDDPTQSPF